MVNDIEQTKYQIILADPPWKFNNKKTGGNMVSGAEFHYPTMTVDQICTLPVPAIAADNAVLFMWWVGTHSEEARKVVEAWGFKVKTMTCFVWVKTTKHGKLHFGMGSFSRAGAECCLVAVKGKPKRIDASIRSVTAAKIGTHSSKPDIFRKKIVKMMGDLPRIELFARENIEGWDAFGNQVPETIELNSEIQAA